jgi:hypothetical protein
LIPIMVIGHVVDDAAFKSRKHQLARLWGFTPRPRPLCAGKHPPVFSVI